MKTSAVTSSQPAFTALPSKKASSVISKAYKVIEETGNDKLIRDTRKLLVDIRLKKGDFAIHSDNPEQGWINIWEKEKPISLKKAKKLIKKLRKKEVTFDKITSNIPQQKGQFSVFIFKNNDQNNYFNTLTDIYKRLKIVHTPKHQSVKNFLINIKRGVQYKIAERSNLKGDDFLSKIFPNIGKPF